MENARGNKDGAWKREGMEEEARNRGRTKAGGCSLGLEKRPAKKEAGGARTGNAAQGTRKCTEVVEGAKEETAARRFPTKPINKKVAQIRTLHSEETREEEEATRRKRDEERGRNSDDNDLEDTSRRDDAPREYKTRGGCIQVSRVMVSITRVSRETQDYIFLSKQPLRPFARTRLFSLFRPVFRFPFATRSYVLPYLRKHASERRRQQLSLLAFRFFLTPSSPFPLVSRLE